MSRVDVFGLVLIKRFQYRGDTNEEWSNKYWLSGPIPNTSQEFKAQADALAQMESACYTLRTHIVRAYGYNAFETDPHADVIPAVWSYDYEAQGEEIAGRLITNTGRAFSGDQAGVVVWKTDRRSVKGKPIWLRKFFHDGYVSSSDSDSLDTDTLFAYNNFVAELGQAPAQPGLGHVRSPVADAAIELEGSKGSVSIHQLKRRGKRPLASTQSGFATNAATPSS